MDQRTLWQSWLVGQAASSSKLVVLAGRASARARASLFKADWPGGSDAQVESVMSVEAVAVSAGAQDIARLAGTLGKLASWTAARPLAAKVAPALVIQARLQLSVFLWV